MQRTNEEETTPDGDKKKAIVWSFPISEIQPQNLKIKLGRISNQDGTDLVYVRINGLKHPNTTIPQASPMYVGKETKDPTLYALSKRMLDSFEDETKSSVEFGHAAQEKIKRGRVIEKKYDQGADGSFFRLANWSWTKPRHFSTADADTLFAKLESKIEQMIPEIVSTAADCAEKRPTLLQERDPVPEEMHRELARLALLDGQLSNTDDPITRIPKKGDSSYRG